MLDFTAIDFETANSFRGSPCSVGIIRVRDGKVTEQHHWLMRPPETADWFDQWNIRIHGITPEMVAEAPRWKEVLPQIVDFVGEDTLIAHNAAFDTGVIRYACEADGIQWPEFDFLCTLVMARKALALPSYRLPYVAASLGFSLENHHDSHADASAVVKIVNQFAQQENATNVHDLAQKIGVRMGSMGLGRYSGTAAQGSSSRGFTPVSVNTDADPAGYLYGRVVVFTGTLQSMTRNTARQECARVGAIPEENTTKRTNVLVVGDIDPSVLRPGSNLTGKTRKAFELQDKGQQIEVMTEDDFLRCLSGTQLEGVENILASPERTSHSTTSHSRTSEAPEAMNNHQVTPKPPKPLKRKPVPTEQECSNTACSATAAFKTRTSPTWCAEHITDVQLQGGLRALEEFTHPNDWQLTECVHCHVQAHYRFNYTLDKNKEGELTCRACYWRQWAKRNRSGIGTWANLAPVPFLEAKSASEDHGYTYLGPLTAPSLGDDPHHVKCIRCGRISAQRLSDIASGCTCTPRN
ncbi:exonuclease domain-containing protein (plasmid) [Glutamicibacter sp. PAEs-4]|uniref:exonuclease domain-containing protein n=1 Tax=Glutamicibacter sp. PAEs-4 TaxID=3444114 RepID=UPI003EBDE022